MEGGKRGSHGAHSPGLVVAHVRSWVLAVLHACSLVEGSSSFMGVHGWLSSFVAVIVGGHTLSSVGGLWSSVALDVHGWVVVVHGHSIFMSGGRLWALDVCGWLWSSMRVVCVVCRQWAVVVVHVGVMFIYVGAVAVVVICRRSWPPVGLDHPCVGGHHPWVVVVNGRLVVGDGGAVVIVVPCHPGLWAFVARKVAVDVARMVYMHATSAVVVGPFVGHHYHRGCGCGRCRGFGCGCCGCCCCGWCVERDG